MTIPTTAAVRAALVVFTLTQAALTAGCSSSNGGSAGSAGGSGSAGTGPIAGETPSDTSAAGIATFLAEGSYQAAGWTSETDAPRAAANSVSPHGRVRVWLNEAAVAANGGTAGPGAMAVKEMYDAADQLVGRAVTLQPGSAVRDVLYYCVGPADRCAYGEPEHTDANPLYGGPSTACAGCHAGMIFTKLP